MRKGWTRDNNSFFLQFNVSGEWRVFISGTYLTGTHRVAATTNPDCTRLYVREADTYKRTSAPSADELAVRERFASVAHMVSLRKKDLSKINADTAAFLAQKDQPGGKQTILSWYWMVCGAEYEETQG